jgi:hypothetical protein
MIRIENQPPVPSKCIACDKEPQEKRQLLSFHDKVLQNPDGYEWTLLMCSVCITEASQILGYPNPREWKKLENEYDKAMEYITKQRATIDRLKEEVKAARLGFFAPEPQVQVQSSEVNPELVAAVIKKTVEGDE